MSSTLPERLIVSEAGEWEQASIYGAVNTMNVDRDKDEWVSHGWEARSYSGTVTYGCRDKDMLLAWLASNGYQPIGDGMHYILKVSNTIEMQDCSIAPGEQEGTYVLTSHYDQESIILTPLALVELAAWVEHKSGLAQEALARRVELQKERGQQ